MGDDLPNVDLGTGASATAVSASWQNTCALLDGGEVKCWGKKVCEVQQTGVFLLLSNR